MDYEKYKNQKEYPHSIRTAERAARLAEIDNTPLTKAERDQSIKDLDKSIEGKHAAMRTAYRQEEQRLTNLFWDDAIEDLNLGYLPKALLHKLKDKAWEDGHSNGLQEVYLHLSDLSEIVELAYKLGKENAE